MAEAEDVLVDVARHATAFAQRLWLRHSAASRPDAISLIGVAERLNLLIAAVFGVTMPLKVAQLPPPITFLTRMFRRETLPKNLDSIPATDDAAIWLPSRLNAPGGLRDYRCMALLQAVRAARGSAAHASAAAEEEVADLYLLLEASSAESTLSKVLPGMRAELERFRLEALAKRPPLDAFPSSRTALERLAREVMRDPFAWSTASPRGSIERAIELRHELRLSDAAGASQARRLARMPSLYLDRWIGEFRASEGGSEMQSAMQHALSDPLERPARSARLPRRPEIREAEDEEDDSQMGAWMVQTAQPQEQAEDPMGMQRPADRDDQTPAEELADSLSELAQARLVRSPEPAKEVLLSDDAPPRASNPAVQRDSLDSATLSYPEWDWRARAYRTPGATVHLLASEEGPLSWVEQTLRAQRTLCDSIRRHFEQLRAHRQRQHRQLEGEEIDLQAYVDARTDFRAGQSMSQALYQTSRAVRRDLAVTLLVDVSGSTDAWVNAHRRIVDVEREALLFVCIALEGLRESYNVLAFSGVGPKGVTVRAVKRFDEPYGETIAKRIAALEPERYTRLGAALRHASALLMRQPARHRLLILLSDGKPNDEDEYDGRYGVEDARQAIVEARLQGINCFCLTVDRHAASYLPHVFGARQYALLQKPELLSRVLLDWLRRLIGAQ